MERSDRMMMFGLLFLLAFQHATFDLGRAIFAALSTGYCFASIYLTFKERQ